MLITKPSQYSVSEAVQAIKTKLQAKNINIIAEIDHAQAARKNNLALNDEILLIFGSPKVGTYLMQEKPSIGIDLPLKLLVWEDVNHQTQIAYLDPIALGERHGIQEHGDILKKMSALLADIS